MQKILATLKSEFFSPILVSGWLFLSGIASLAGAVGSCGPSDFLRRLMFWCPSLAAAIGVMMGMRVSLRSMAGARVGRWSGAVAALGATAICAPPLYLLHQAVLGPGGPGFAGPVVFAVLLLFCLMIASTLPPVAPANGLRVMAAPLPAPLPMPAPLPVADLTPAAPPAAADPAPSAPAAAVLPRIVQRLEPGAQGRLVSLTVRNHHVDVVTEAGQGSVLIRFSDAMAETAPEPGDQVHRSHWVAWWAIRGADRAEGKIWLRLVGGARLPVSKPHRAKVEARGLI